MPRDARRFPGRNAADQQLVDRVVHHHLVGVDGAGARPLADAERIEGGERVRPELDAGADLAERAGLLEHLTSRPRRVKASAAARPPMPPPATMTGRVSGGVLTATQLSTDIAGSPIAGP